MALDILLECDRVADLISAREIVDINQLVTEPEDYNGQAVENGLEADIGGSGFEVARDEDYHLVREKGQLETIIETMLPYECREDSELVNLTAFLMTEIARSQVFAEGNKRTSYVAGTLFLIKAQMLARNEAVYPRLDTEMTTVLSEVARGERSREKFEEYLRQRLSMQ